MWFPTLSTTVLLGWRMPCGSQVTFQRSKVVDSAWSNSKDAGGCPFIHQCAQSATLASRPTFQMQQTVDH
eukprot:m.62711 g.62711  ORF g.62711 m.62711 type:complete len:70 (+) comp9624_c0_seq3:2117-2326(+)